MTRVRMSVLSFGAIAAVVILPAGGRGHALPAPDGTWRLFSDESPWNTPIEN